jgi:hypothetical protein
MRQEEVKSPCPVAPEVPGEFIKFLKRLEVLERSVPKFDLDDLVRIRKEVLDGGFGSMRYRMVVMEAQVQSLGGSIAWETKNSDLISEKITHENHPLIKL